jgi:hypothetical protein
MLYWFGALLFGGIFAGTIAGVIYRLWPSIYQASTTSPIQKAITYSALAYPLLYIIALFIFGNEHNVPDPAHHVTSALIFLTGHIFLSILATATGIFLYKKKKINMVFIITNMLAGTMYFAYTALGLLSM